MGWLEGVLSGYSKRHYEIEAEKRRDAELAADRQERIFKTFLDSPYQDLKDYAAAGILDLGNPRKRKGGVAGWMGEVEQTPYLDMIRRTREKIGNDSEFAEANLSKPYFPWLGQGSEPGGEQGGAPPPTPSIPNPAGSVSAPPAGTPPLAQPSTSLVTNGPATAPTPAPSAPPPTPPPRGLQGMQPIPNAPAVPPNIQPIPNAPGGVPPTLEPLAAAAPTDAAAPTPAPPAGPPLPVSEGPPVPPGLVAAGLPGATTRIVGPGARVPPSRMQLPATIPTQGDLALDAARGRAAGSDLGEQESWIRVAQAQGLSSAEGLKMWAAAQQTRLSGGAYTTFNIEYLDPVTRQVTRKLARVNSRTGQLEDMAGTPLPSDARRIGQQRTPEEAYSIARATQMGRDTLRWSDAVQRAVTAYPGVPLDDILKAADAFYQSKPPGSLPPTMQPDGGGGRPTPVVPPADPTAVPPVDPAAAPPVDPTAPPGTSPADVVRKNLEASNPELLSVPRRAATDTERKDLQYAERMQQAEESVRAPGADNTPALEDRMLRQSLGGQSWGKYGFYPMLTDDQKLYRLAQMRFTEARLRLESGMLIRPEEYESDAKMYFVQPGDNAVTIAAKQAARRQLLEGRFHEAGPAYFEKYRRQYQPAAPPVPPVPFAAGHTPAAPSATAPAQTPPPAAAPPTTPMPSHAVQRPDGSWVIEFTPAP